MRFFSVEAWGLQSLTRYLVFFVIDLSTRKVEIIEVQDRSLTPCHDQVPPGSAASARPGLKNSQHIRQTLAIHGGHHMNTPPTGQFNLDAPAGQSAAVDPLGTARGKPHRHECRRSRGVSQTTLLLLSLAALQFAPPEVEGGLSKLLLAAEPTDGQPAAAVIPDSTPPLRLKPLISILRLTMPVLLAWSTLRRWSNRKTRWDSPDAYERWYNPVSEVKVLPYAHIGPAS